MKNLGNQRGYALLIVMLTIIIFLSLSAVFVQTSLNHVTQEQTVDVKNQAVVAAEMGVKFFATDISNNINGILSILKKELASQTECERNNNCICPNLKQKKLSTVEDLTEEINNCLQQEVEKLIANKSSSYIIGKKISSDENLNLSFNLQQQIEINDAIEDDKIGHNLTIHVNGNSKNGSIAYLEATIFVGEIETSDFTTELKSVSNAQNKLENSKIFHALPTKLCSSLIKSDVEKSSGLLECKLSSNEEATDLVTQLARKNINLANLSIYAESINSFCGNGNCNKPDLDVFGDAVLYMQQVTVGNFNNAKSLNLIVNGKLVVDNANNLGDYNKKTYILVKEFDGKNQFDLINGTMIFTGTENTNSVFDLKHSFKLVNSTACFNLAKFENNANSLNNIKSISGNGRLVILNTTNSTAFRREHITSPGVQVLIETDPNKFAKECDFNQLGFNNTYSLESSLSNTYVENVLYN